MTEEWPDTLDTCGIQTPTTIRSPQYSDVPSNEQANQGARYMNSNVDLQPLPGGGVRFGMSIDLHGDAQSLVQSLMNFSKPPSTEGPTPLTQLNPTTHSIVDHTTAAQDPHIAQTSQPRQARTPMAPRHRRAPSCFTPERAAIDPNWDLWGDSGSVGTMNSARSMREIGVSPRRSLRRGDLKNPNKQQTNHSVQSKALDLGRSDSKGFSRDSVVRNDVRNDAHQGFGADGAWQHHQYSQQQARRTQQLSQYSRHHQQYSHETQRGSELAQVTQQYVNPSLITNMQCSMEQDQQYNTDSMQFSEFQKFEEMMRAGNQVREKGRGGGDGVGGGGRRGDFVDLSQQLRSVTLASDSDDDDVSRGKNVAGVGHQRGGVQGAVGHQQGAVGGESNVERSSTRVPHLDFNSCIQGGGAIQGRTSGARMHERGVKAVHSAMVRDTPADNRRRGLNSSDTDSSVDMKDSPCSSDVDPRATVGCEFEQKCDQDRHVLAMHKPCIDDSAQQTDKMYVVDFDHQGKQRPRVVQKLNFEHAQDHYHQPSDADVWQLNSRVSPHLNPLDTQFTFNDTQYSTHSHLVSQAGTIQTTLCGFPTPNAQPLDSAWDSQCHTQGSNPMEGDMGGRQGRPGSSEGYHEHRSGGMVGDGDRDVWGREGAGSEMVIQSARGERRTRETEWYGLAGGKGSEYEVRRAHGHVTQDSVSELVGAQGGSGEFVRQGFEKDLQFDIDQSQRCTQPQVDGVGCGFDGSCGGVECGEHEMYQQAYQHVREVSSGGKLKYRLHVIPEGRAPIDDVAGGQTNTTRVLCSPDIRGKQGVVQPEQGASQKIHRKLQFNDVDIQDNIQQHKCQTYVDDDVAMDITNPTLHPAHPAHHTHRSDKHPHSKLPPHQVQPIPAPCQSQMEWQTHTPRNSHRVVSQHNRAPQVTPPHTPLRALGTPRGSPGNPLTWPSGATCPIDANQVMDDELAQDYNWPLKRNLPMKISNKQAIGPYQRYFERIKHCTPPGHDKFSATGTSFPTRIAQTPSKIPRQPLKNHESGATGTNSSNTTPQKPSPGRMTPLQRRKSDIPRPPGVDERPASPSPFRGNSALTPGGKLGQVHAPVFVGCDADSFEGAPQGWRNPNCIKQIGDKGGEREECAEPACKKQGYLR